ncbi:MAG: DUF4331 domain-containing protein [Verrucomicrobiota bacterium]|nr:DUF4331 domain-containing protein [Verrucomicrobiota bacterium]
MSQSKSKRSLLRRAGVGITASLAFVAMQSSWTPRLFASDHIDSPALAQDRGSDIADFYAFLDPNDNSQVVLIMSTQGFVVSGEHFGEVIFDHNIRYRFEIENTGDARPDLFLDVHYAPGVGRLTAQQATITLSDPTPNGVRRLARFTAPPTVANQEPQPEAPPAPVVTTDSVSGIQFYAGAADDPFFLDDTGANRFVASSLLNPGSPDTSLLGFRLGRDTYAGFNTLITAVRIPVALLQRNTTILGFNALTQRHKVQVLARGAARGVGTFVNADRQGNPLVNNGLIPAARKDEYNGSTTVEDKRGRFRADLITDLSNFGTDQTHIDTLLGIIQENGDILRLDTTVPNTGSQGGTNSNGGYGNLGGRRLVDDVVDIVFTIINNDNPLTDFVDGNEVAFRDEFPFVADPTQPFPPGSDPDDHTRQ